MRSRCLAKSWTSHWCSARVLSSAGGRAERQEGAACEQASSVSREMHSPSVRWRVIREHARTRTHVYLKLKSLHNPFDRLFCPLSCRSGGIYIGQASTCAATERVCLKSLEDDTGASIGAPLTPSRAGCGILRLRPFVAALSTHTALMLPTTQRTHERFRTRRKCSNGQGGGV